MANRRDFLKHLGFQLNPPPMSNDNTLPEAIKEQIKTQANDHSNKWWQGAKGSKGLHLKTTCYYAYIAGATEYAQWKVKHEQAMAILKFNHPVLYNQIKSFLDGTK